MRQCWSTYFEYFKDSNVALFLTKSEIFYVNILLRHYSFERFLYSHLIFDNLTFSGTWPARGIYPKTECTIALGELSKWNFFFFFHIKLNRMYWQLENLWRLSQLCWYRKKTVVSFSVMVTVEIRKLKVISKIRVM